MQRGRRVWVKYHFKTEQGVKNLDVNLAAKLAGENPDYHTEDLFNAIEKGDFPAWKLYVQIMPLEDADTYRFDPFDVTKVWSQKDYPLIEWGVWCWIEIQTIILPEVEQATFSPGGIVPGIEASPDKMLQGRLFAYADAHRYRVGANHNTLPINRPNAEVNNYQRDGQMRSDSNGGGTCILRTKQLWRGNQSEAISQRLLQYPVLLIVLLTIIMIISHRRATCIVYLAWINALVWCKILLAL